VSVADLDFFGVCDQEPSQGVDASPTLADLVAALSPLAGMVPDCLFRPSPIVGEQRGGRSGCRWVEWNRFDGSATNSVDRRVQQIAKLDQHLVQPCTWVPTVRCSPQPDPVVDAYVDADTHLSGDRLGDVSSELVRIVRRFESSRVVTVAAVSMNLLRASCLIGRSAQVHGVETFHSTDGTGCMVLHNTQKK
jgi:hypothetical protein